MRREDENARLCSWWRIKLLFEKMLVRREYSVRMSPNAVDYEKAFQREAT